MSIDNTLPVAHISKAKIFTIGGNKIFAYIAGLIAEGSLFVTFDLTASTHDITVYTAPVATGSVANDQDIWGFEYLPAHNVFCFAYNDAYLSTGGLGYTAPGTTAITPIPSTSDYRFSDLELDKNGDMLMVYNNSGSGTLSYLASTELTSSFTSTTPHRVTTLCGSTVTNISVYNFQVRDGYVPNYYLGSQIRGENYSLWGPGTMPPQVITTNVTWTSVNNPVAIATGLPAYSINCSDIEIDANASLTITGLEVNMAPGSHIDVLAGSAMRGGRLVLNSSHLQAAPSSCDGGFSMWGGIRLGGVSYYPQTPVTTTKQAMLTMTSSYIQYADTAVSCAFDGAHDGGAVVTARLCDFINNTMDVYFAPYRSPLSTAATEYPNASGFLACNFTADDARVAQPRMYDVYEQGVNAIGFVGCHFE